MRLGRRTLLCALLLAGCLGKPRATVDFPLRATVIGNDAPIELADGWSAEVSDARLAFGPLYLCGGFNAGELCKQAGAEYTHASVIDFMDPNPQAMGRMFGQSGFVRSWMYDLGYSSILTSEAPLESAAALELGSKSFVLSGTLRKGARSIAFQSGFAISSGNANEAASPGVPRVRKAGNDPAVEQQLTESTIGLNLRFDLRNWFFAFSALEFDRPGECSTEAKTICDRGDLLTCDINGDELSRSPCAGACIEGACKDAINLNDFIELRSTLKAGQTQANRPEFEFINQ